MKIEILVNRGEILGSNYVSFRCYDNSKLASKRIAMITSKSFFGSVGIYLLKVWAKFHLTILRET